MRGFRAVLVLASLAVLAIPAAPAAAHHGDRRGARAFDLEAHRGGRGLRPENTLASSSSA